VLALVVIIGSLCIFHSVSTRFVERVRSDRDDLADSLRQAHMPEPEIAVTSRAFDRVASEGSDILSMSLLAFTSVVLVAAFAARRSEPPRADIQRHTQGELRHEPAA